MKGGVWRRLLCGEQVLCCRAERVDGNGGTIEEWIAVIQASDEVDEGVGSERGKK